MRTRHIEEDDTPPTTMRLDTHRVIDYASHTEAGDGSAEGCAGDDFRAAERSMAAYRRHRLVVAVALFAVACWLVSLTRSNPSNHDKDTMNAPILTPVAQAAHTTAESELDRLLRAQQDYSPRYMMEGDSFDKMLRLAEQMASSRVSVPEHLRGNVGDCLAIITQAMLWNMNPFAVAQKTHIVSGRLGYEAQLVNAVVQNSGAVRGAPSYEYRGEGQALACRVGFVLRGGSEVTWGEWLSVSDVTTKNSPLWKTNPKQQMGYLQIKNWARAFVPGAILGVHTTDELEQLGAGFDSKSGGVDVPALEKPNVLPDYAADAFAANLPKWAALVAEGKKTAAALLATLSTKATFSEQQKAQILALKPKPAEAPPPADPRTDEHGEFLADMDAAGAQ